MVRIEHGKRLRWDFRWAAVLLVMSACAAEHREPREAKGRSDSVDGQHTFVPTDGYIPDSQTAVRVAEAVLVAIYGNTIIGEQKPLVATLREGQWHVAGTLPEEYLGGVAIVVLNRSDGRIIRVSHGL